jgi:two-component system sensor histidine kinase UhpB
MRLRTRLNLIVAGLSVAFVAVLMAAEIEGLRGSVREEIEAAHRVAAHLLGRLASVYSTIGGPDLVMQFVHQLGRVRANEVYLVSPDGQEIWRAPPASYKAGREAPGWFARLLRPPLEKDTFVLRGGVQLVVESQPSRAVLDAWDHIVRLALLGALMLVAVNLLVFGTLARVLRPIPVIAAGLERLERGELSYRLPPLADDEMRGIGAAFNRMAQAMQDKVAAERQARDAESRLEERREMASLADQRVEEERRLIAHELHDEFGQSVTAIRSLAQAIATQQDRERTVEAARLISEEAARLYDAMHSLIPRLAPPSLDSLGLVATLENLVRDWQRRHPAVAIRLEHRLPADLGPSVTLALYRVVQEGLVNALRHARAAHIDIRLEADGERLRVQVADDGLGLPADWARPGHYGLRGLADRLRQLQGECTVAARPEGGTLLSAEIPWMVAA